MISALPNQPLSFTDTRLQGCLCDQPEECLMVDFTDTISTQFVYAECLSAQLLASPNFEDPADWFGPTWDIQADHNACLEGVPPFGPLLEMSFDPIPGSLYIIRVLFTDVTGPTLSSGLRLQFGGVLNEIITGTMVGEQTYTVTAVSGQHLIISSYLSGTGCLAYAEVYESTPQLEVELLDASGDPVGSFEWATSSTLFDFEEDRVTITFTATDFQVGGYPIEPECGKFTIRVTDNCDGSQHISQCVALEDYSTTCTIQLKACNSGDGVGFVGNFEPTMRVRSKLTRPVYEYTVREERLSNGRLDRYYADRRRTMELRIDRLGEKAHEFISTLPLWDHVYVGPEAYVVKADQYEPAYGDVYESYGGILLKVEPYQELARKVRCAEDDGGCAPPPNYLVQFTGPNDDYVLQEDGSRILIY